MLSASIPLSSAIATAAARTRSLVRGVRAGLTSVRALMAHTSLRRRSGEAPEHPVEDAGAAGLVERSESDRGPVLVLGVEEERAVVDREHLGRSAPAREHEPDLG